MANLVARGLEAGIEQAVRLSAGEVDRFIARARATRPDMTDAELLKALKRSYVGLVTTTGAAAGGAAAVPGAGLVAGGAAALADAAAFTTATATYVLAVASVHGIDVDDIEQRRVLLLTALAGPQGPAIIQRVAGRTGAHWGRHVTGAVPASSLRQINKALGRNFVTKYGTKQGVLVLGKTLPVGFGAAIGAGGNYALARGVTRTVKHAFGEVSPAPTVFAAEEEILES